MSDQDRNAAFALSYAKDYLAGDKSIGNVLHCANAFLDWLSPPGRHLQILAYKNGITFEDMERCKITVSDTNRLWRESLAHESNFITQLKGMIEERDRDVNTAQT